MVMFLILESCQIYIDELHNRISQLEGGQAVSHPASAAVSPGPVAASTRPPLSHPAAASVAPPSSQPALAASNWPSVAAGSSRSIRPLATTEHQQVFGYMPRSDRGRSRACGSGRQPPAKKKHNPTWTRAFVCLASTADGRMPSTAYYHKLKKASLGEKNMTFNLEDNSVEFDYKLKMAFPKLEMAGGYILMCSHNTRRTLEEIKPPYTVQRLKRETGQCKIFIRPLQSDLDLTLDVYEEENEVKLY